MIQNTLPPDDRIDTREREAKYALAKDLISNRGNVTSLSQRPQSPMKETV